MESCSGEHVLPQQQQPSHPVNTIGFITQPLPSSEYQMPTPTTHWSIEAMPWKMPPLTEQEGKVMKFTASCGESFRRNTLRSVLLNHKRKSDLNMLPPMPAKQFISEEKFTAHFNGLHISSDYIQHNSGSSSGEAASITSSAVTGKNFTNLTYADYQITAKELEEKLRNVSRITLCEELKKFQEQQKKTAYLPEALFNRIEKPCTALVLWQPPPILNLLKDQTANKNKNVPEELKANDIEITDEDSIELAPEESVEIDDFIDNNNTCNVDFNVRLDGMDEDL
uniref:Uncharacterized protein n=1 Tax=Glossina morsitans morsitans TaxID=37546 RepID=A0A1B0FDK5_GLOMM